MIIHLLMVRFVSGWFTPQEGRNTIGFVPSGTTLLAESRRSPVKHYQDRDERHLHEFVEDADPRLEQVSH